MRRISNKRRRLLRKRTAMLASLDRSRCAAEALIPEIACWGPVDPHEPLTRARGGSLTDPANTVFLCRAHHSWVHHNPREAHGLGLLVHSWERGRTFNFPPRWGLSR